MLESTDKEKGENKRFQESGGIEIRKGEEKQTKEKVTPNFANREEYEKWKEGRLREMDKRGK